MTLPEGQLLLSEGRVVRFNDVNSPDNMEGAKALVRRFRLTTTIDAVRTVSTVRHNYSNCRGPSIQKLAFYLVDKNGQVSHAGDPYRIRMTRDDRYLEARVEGIDCMTLGFSFTIE